MQNALNGIINVYKEKGYTSHDVVAKLRGILKMKKIGHTGTLDPEAEGVLPVCLGNATKLCEMLTEKEKTYKAVMVLGISTDTEDMTGKVIKENEPEVIKGLDAVDVKKAVESFAGTYDQIPPMYSAIKVDGKKLYELAREGKVIERKPRRVEILEIKDISINLPEVSFSVTCSKGTYVRSLCRDIGEKLGVCACMKSLVRTRVSVFNIKDSLKLSEIELIVKSEDENIENHIVSVEKSLMGFGRITVKEDEDKALLNGNKLEFDEKRLEEIVFENAYKSIDNDVEDKNCSYKDKDSGYINKVDINLFDINKIQKKDGLLIRVYSSNNKFIGLYKKDEGNFFKPYKMFL